MKGLFSSSKRAPSPGPPQIYKERSAVNFQEEELNRMKQHQGGGSGSQPGTPILGAQQPPSGTPGQGTPSKQYKERSAVNFQEEELKRLQAAKQGGSAGGSRP